MTTILLIVIYIAFISLGLPNSITTVMEDKMEKQWQRGDS